MERAGGITEVTGVEGATGQQAAGSGRARGIAAAISGFFAFSWFGGGMNALAPGLLTTLLQAGRALSVVVAILGVVLAVRSPAESTPMRDRAVGRRYGIVVGVEFGLLAVGGFALTHTVGAQWVPVWICAGVGIHFVPLSRVFRERSLMVLAVAITAVAGVAIVVALTSSVAPGTITGAGAGLSLLVSAAVTLLASHFYTGLTLATPA